MDNFLTPEEMAKRLRVPMSWIYARTRDKSNNSIPYKKVGKYIRFIESDVMKWLENNQQEG